MRFLILIVSIIFICTTIAFGQAYKAEYVQVINFGSKADTNLATLLFNKKESLYSYGQNDDISKSPIMTSSDSNMMDERYDVKLKLGDSKGFFYHANLDSKIFTNRERLPSKPVIVIDTMMIINWKIDSIAEKKIENFNCKKAIGEFRGRAYEVWFTEDIPISFGPWKLWGLPGLIVEAKDLNSDIINIKLRSLKSYNESIIKPMNEQIMTQEEFVKNMKKAMKNLSNYLSTSSSSEGVSINSKIKFKALEISFYNN